MPHHRVPHLVLLALTGVLVPAVLTAEHPQGPVPTLWNEPPELPSGAGPFDTTTAAHVSDSTGFPPYTSEYEPEDTTHLHRLDDGNGLSDHDRPPPCVCSDPGQDWCSAGTIRLPPWT
ncbi:protein SNORC isoform X2 [Alligator mississippiensis]|uniref:protein SNORC isoform X2 n=1 Tax=Alligator mississippiensis TaxID=8496 RepID=UPI0009070D44|nr:protein SNORC isoform X2 [Alligator mississippiensis]